MNTLERLAEILRSNGWTVTPPEANPVPEPEQFVMPDEDATSLELAAFIEGLSFEIERDARLVRRLFQQDPDRYRRAFAMLDFEAMFAGWTDEQVIAGIGADKRGIWNMAPQLSYNKPLNLALSRERNRRFPRDEVQGLGMGEDGRQA